VKARAGRPVIVSRSDFVVATWGHLGNPRVGMKELREIQNLMRERLGEGSVQSPAAIARVLAGAGAELRHPEVIEFDAEWRESQLEREAKKFKGLKEFSADEPLRLKQAEAVIDKLERLRQRFERQDDRAGLEKLKALAGDALRAAQSIAQDRTSEDALRVEQSEVAEWIKVWIQTPNLFADWVDLRRRSPDFRKKFLTKTSS
jgi:hypothetical protein